MAQEQRFVDLPIYPDSSKSVGQKLATASLLVSRLLVECMVEVIVLLVLMVRMRRTGHGLFEQVLQEYLDPLWMDVRKIVMPDRVVELKLVRLPVEAVVVLVLEEVEVV